MYIYLASGWFTPEALELCKALEKVVRSVSVDSFLPRVDQAQPTGVDLLQAAKDIFDCNIEHLDRATIVVANTTHNDMGTLFEAGYACQRSKIVINFNANNKFELFDEFDYHVSDLSKLKELLEDLVTLNVNHDKDENEDDKDEPLFELDTSSKYELIENELEPIICEANGCLDSATFCVIDTSSRHPLAFWKAGYAYGANTKIIYYAPGIKRFNLMLAQSAFAIALTEEQKQLCIAQAKAQYDMYVYLKKVTNTAINLAATAAILADQIAKSPNLGLNSNPAKDIYDNIEQLNSKLSNINIEPIALQYELE